MKRLKFTVFDYTTGETSQLDAADAQALVDKASSFNRVARDVLVYEKVQPSLHNLAGNEHENLRYEIWDAKVTDRQLVRA